MMIRFIQDRQIPDLYDLCDLYDVANVAGGSRIMCMIQGMFPALDLYRTDPAQHLITAGQDLSDLHRDLYDLDRDISDLDRDVSDLDRKSI